MLRSIFTLIQRIIDSDTKIYDSTKSKAIIFCFTNPDDTINMNFEVDGKKVKSMKNIKYEENKLAMEDRDNTFEIRTEFGDTVTCKHKTDINIIPKGAGEEKHNRTVSFVNKDGDAVDKCIEINESIDEARTNVQDLMKNFPKKRIELNSKGKDQIAYLLEQVQKMKTGLKRLQEIVGQLNYSEHFGEDVNYLVNNAKKSLENTKDEASSLTRNNLYRKN